MRRAARFKSAKQPTKSLFLVLNRLLPGDVVLCTERKTISESIARELNGQFAHAALILDDPCIWFESRTDGVGITLKIPDKFPVIDGVASPLLDVSRYYAAFTVLRHPAMETLSEQKRVAAVSKLGKMATDLTGLYYARLESLIELAPRWKNRRISKLLLRAGDLLTGGCKPLPGPFCSALIVVMYEEIGLDLSNIRHVHPVRRQSFCLNPKAAY
jgi:hypothetical protein